jgi:poly(A) polymerase Pap1
MFPTEDEQQQRSDAFALLEAVLAGSSTESNVSEIPMVIVPVGSYALGVWTSVSDIDCLCIGSITPKTFFQLARQRIRRAEAQGIRVIRRVEADTGTMLELSVNGVAVNLQYCPAARIVDR